LIFATLTVAAMLAPRASAQMLDLVPQDSSSRNLLLVAADDASAFEESSASLPDAPSAVLRGSIHANLEAADHPVATGPEARKYAKYISAGWTAQPLTAHDKVILGLRDSVSPFSFLGILASAGYSHVLNGQPNFGTDKGAFGQRLGATAIRDISENIFSDSVYAPMLHEDPRYYVEGPQHNLFQRVIYSVTRPIITRTDSGRNTVNVAKIAGDASGAAISYTYYPKINQNFRDTAATFGGALAGDAVGDFVSEFSDQVLVFFHLKKQQ
jgi:hypothetical protein